MSAYTRWSRGRDFKTAASRTGETPMQAKSRLWAREKQRDKYTQLTNRYVDGGKAMTYSDRGPSDFAFHSNTVVERSPTTEQRLRQSIQSLNQQIQKTPERQIVKETTSQNRLVDPATDTTYSEIFVKRHSPAVQAALLALAKGGGHPREMPEFAARLLARENHSGPIEPSSTISRWRRCFSA